ncbi:MAG: endolytic transglycosylase MltG [Holosporaceae bacterium]|nr:endolytic transglycosylase MltG [Holosporaceae bacterium]
MKACSSERCSRGRIVNFLLGFFGLLALVVLFFVYYMHKSSLYVPERGLIVDQPTDDAFSRLLVENKIADCYVMNKICVKIMKKFRYEIKFGEYALPHHVSLYDTIKIISSGQVIIHKITFPEGFSVVQTLRRLEKDENLRGKIEKIPPEGSLMPDTYCFKYPTTRQEIISWAQQAMRNFLWQEWPKRSPKCTLQSPREALILASIVEKETNLEKERIAGVYLRRLAIGMKLQSCPTVIYGLQKGERLYRPLNRADLIKDMSHNTYVYPGLPPTPITNPGRTSIIAVLHPKETDEIFFVYEGAGRHAFAKTYDEHKRNIARIQKKDISQVR